MLHCGILREKKKDSHWNFETGILSLLGYLVGFAMLVDIPEVAKSSWDRGAGFNTEPGGIKQNITKKHPQGGAPCVSTLDRELW